MAETLELRWEVGSLHFGYFFQIGAHTGGSLQPRGPWRRSYVPIKAHDRLSVTFGGSDLTCRSMFDSVHNRISFRTFLVASKVASMTCG